MIVADRIGRLSHLVSAAQQRSLLSTAGESIPRLKIRSPPASSLGRCKRRLPLASVLDGLPKPVRNALTPDDVALVSKAEELAREEVAPRATEIDRSEMFPEFLLNSFFDTGLMTMQAPVEWGGGGASLTAQVLAIEAIACASASAAEILDAQASALVTVLGARYHVGEIAVRRSLAQSMASSLRSHGTGGRVRRAGSAYYRADRE